MKIAINPESAINVFAINGYYAGKSDLSTLDDIREGFEIDSIDAPEAIPNGSTHASAGTFFPTFPYATFSSRT